MKELKYLNKYFQKYKGKLLLGILITVIAQVFSLFAPKLIGNSLTTVQQYIDSEITDLTIVKDALFTNILIIVGASILAAFFTFLMRQTIINISRYVEYDLKNEVYQQYQNLSTNFYKKNRTGDLMNRISEDVGKVRMYAGPAIMYSIRTITLFACLIPLMFITAPKVAIYTLVPLPILAFLIYKLSRAIQKRSAVVQQFLSKLSTFTQESFSGVSVIKAYGIEPQIKHTFDAMVIEGKQKNMALVKVQAWFFPMMILLIGASNILVIYIGGQQYINGEIKFGVLAEFIMYVNMLTWPVATIGWVTSIVQQAEVSQGRINEFLKVAPEIQNQIAKATPIKGNIEFKDVSFTYDDTNITALKNVSFTLNSGETLAIVGKTGSGKTTILDLISRMYDIEKGVIEIDKIPIKELNLNSLRNATSIVPQDAFLFSETIKDNIKFGKEDATEAEVIEAAKFASVHENIIGFKKGYDTILGERGITLSGGQKQRVSIARAIIKDPNILLLDDCLSAVDTETEEEILNNIQRITKNKTTIIVSHRISSAKNADKIIVLDDGRIIQNGSYDDLIEQDGYFKQLYLKQLSEKDL
ncbi:putative multidrug resistance ABC transporter ATP-binding/permease protein YheI [Kordia antarctica]|uniref:Putative multidrug resistance ABC transporter ATP-binding/permease protein YheI n=1 Tax=Kordia antarctica TaxID=1218801 RepID=A0A7L4ZGH7_9FLAO|nr:ABC transporter ATP-binding protein [Kordia antarctica]QHI35547.1 putative multidrug resistance ABC transporter ATP-binding/permease protein YheI [Kordia antarctica]